MGRYVTIQEIKDTTPEDILKWLTDGDPKKNPSTWVINEARISDAIERAESTVDAWVGKRYVVPLDLTKLTEQAAGAKIKLAARLLAISNLYDDIGHRDKGAAKFMQALGTKDSPGVLRSIAAGTIELPGAEAYSRKRIYYDAPPRRFGGKNSNRQGNTS